MTSKAKENKEEKLPKLKIGNLQFNHVLVTGDYKGKDSGIIMPESVKGNSRTVKNVQRIISVGEHVNNFNIGDKVMLDTDKLQAKNARVLGIAYDPASGEVIHDDNEKNFEKKYLEEKIETAFLITDREILFKIK